MAMPEQNREVVLPPGTYLYVQDGTKGTIKTLTGPNVATLSGNDVPVVFDDDAKAFKRAASLDAAVRRSPIAVEGYYLVLLNPVNKPAGNAHPPAGATSISPDLDVGRKVVIPGPVTFALYPGQIATMLKGHHLRSNEYLRVRVYNDAEAKANWGAAVIKAADGAAAGAGGAVANVAGGGTVAVSQAPVDIAVGKTYIIKGTDVAFYIPPTGVTVERDPNGNYVRKAVSLERLEYAILIDENGSKRYEHGPQVVFPSPTERFATTADEKFVFRPIELNEIQGIHIKVIAAYTDGDPKDIASITYEEGEELFLTGKDTPIYYPRPEHAIVTYDGRAKHFAIAVPAGEARYVMNRMTGHIRTVAGPAMLLPDPRSEVVVRRVLTDTQCGDWYPNNNDAIAYNRELRELAKRAPTTRRGAVSEGEVERAVTRGAGRAKPPSEQGYGGLGGTVNTASLSVGAAAAQQASTFANLVSSSSARGMERSVVHADAAAGLSDAFSRGSSYSEPRTITFDTRFDGAPRVDVWTGFAVMVTDAAGKRRVETGPKTILLGYDESLETLSLSTGNPKNSDKQLRTVYLKHQANRVSDTVTVETQDHVAVTVRLAFRVSFTGEPTKWFGVDDYVRLLCEHARSVLKAAVRNIAVAEFYKNPIESVRNLILGVKPAEGNAARPGMSFSENGMRVDDVEVVNVSVENHDIAILFNEAQHAAVKDQIQLERSRASVAVLDETERLARLQAQIKADSHRLGAELAKQILADDRVTFDAQQAFQTDKAKAEVELAGLRASAAQKQVDDDAARLAVTAKARADAAAVEQAPKIAMLEADTKAITARIAAIPAGLIDAMLSMSARDTVIEVAKASGMERVLGGKTLDEAVAAITGSTDVTAILRTVLTRAAVAPVNGTSRKTPDALPLP